VRHAVARGHRVSIFTRGRRTADLAESVIRLQGDRNGQLGALEGKKWDAVFDDSATNPEWVRLSTALLKDNAGAYLFTSSTGVHYPYLKRGIDERDPILYTVADSKDGSATYGAAKAQCERITMDAFGDREIVVRPTYIVGPGDTSDRFPYWPQRIMKGGETLAPGKRDDPMQIVDVRDLAEFMVKLVEDGKRGVYEVAGPAKPMLVRDFYPAAAKALGANPTFVYVHRKLPPERHSGKLDFGGINRSDRCGNRSSRKRRLWPSCAKRRLACRSWRCSASTPSVGQRFTSGSRSTVARASPSCSG